MKNSIKFILASLIISCSTLSLNSYASNRDVGFFTGGIAGGLLGSAFGRGGGQVFATAAGALAGAAIGSSIGRNMDETDEMVMGRALEHNRVGQPVYWQNARTGMGYRVVPVRNVYFDDGYYCREYKEVVYSHGRNYITYHTACRDGYGYWAIRS